jgi:hypothetical protein
MMNQATSATWGDLTVDVVQRPLECVIGAIKGAEFAGEIAPYCGPFERWLDCRWGSARRASRLLGCLLRRDSLT